MESIAQEAIPLMQKTLQISGIRLFGAASMKKLIVIAFCGMAALALTRTAAAQQTGYIKISSTKGPVDGSSKDPAYKGWSAIRNAVDVPTPQDVARESSQSAVSEVVVTRPQTSVQVPGKVGMPRESSSGMSSGRTAATQATESPRDLATGQSSGKRMHKPITITKEVDSASPLLHQMQVSGETLPEVNLAIGVSKYKLSDVVISSIQSATGGAGSGKIELETISFAYQKIEITK